MTDFARLETHHGLQVLSRVEAITTDDDRYGPAVITRCDPSVSIEIKQGPFADTDDGWTEAEAVWPIWIWPSLHRVQSRWRGVSQHQTMMKLRKAQHDKPSLEAV